jgi:hypothetical protein
LITKNQAAIRDLFKVVLDTAGNLPPLRAVFPDQMAPVVRVNDGEREDPPSEAAQSQPSLPL